MTTYALAPVPAPSSRRRSTTSWAVDIVVGITGWAALVLIGMCAVYFSFFFAMAGDGCYSAAQCPREDLIGTGMFTVWAGVAVALLIALVGSLVSLIRQRYFWYWPLIGITIVVATTWVGVELANTGGGLS